MRVPYELFSIDSELSVLQDHIAESIFKNKTKQINHRHHSKLLSSTKATKGCPMVYQELIRELLLHSELLLCNVLVPGKSLLEM